MKIFQIKNDEGMWQSYVAAQDVKFDLGCGSQTVLCLTGLACIELTEMLCWDTVSIKKLTYEYTHMSKKFWCKALFWA
jgi:hypothetical protein